MVKHALVATDGLRHARKTVEFALELVRRYGAKLTVRHVVTPGTDIEALREYAKSENLPLDDGPSAGRLFGEGVIEEVVTMAKGAGIMPGRRLDLNQGSRNASPQRCRRDRRLVLQCGVRASPSGPTAPRSR